MGPRVQLIMETLLEQGISATFFIVGEWAEQHTALVRQLAANGFEIGSHAFRHIPLNELNPTAAIAEINRSKILLEEISGTQVTGFRAPSWSASLGDHWLWDALSAAGFDYDSSLFPLRTTRFGSSANPLQPFLLQKDLMEIPPAAWSFGPLRLPVGGGFWFRLFPLPLTQLLLRQIIKQSRSPVCYFHPWEFEKQQSPEEQEVFNRFIGNYRITGNWERFLKLVTEYDCVDMQTILAESGDMVLESRPQITGQD